MYDFDDWINRSNQFGQQDTIIGLHKGVVVDVRDPFRQGRVRVHIYGIHGDYKDLKVDALPWADIIVPVRGGHAPAELWDRVWVTFDAGDRNSPVVVGFWYGVPTGRGTLPHTRTKGTEIRPENWHHHDLYPETLMFGCSGNGNAIWTEDKYLSDNFLSSSINLEDTGGKYIKIKSYHPDVAAFAADSGLPDDLYKADVPERVPVRDGETPVKEVSSGSIEMGHQNLHRYMFTDDEYFTVDRMVQYDQEDELGIEKIAIGGNVLKQRQGRGSFIQASNAMFMNAAAGVYAPSLQTLPRRWDR